MSIFEGYLSMGGVELVNNTRTRGIMESARPCPMHWLKGPTCAAMPSALFDQDGYTWDTITAAPWFDPDLPQSSDFYGFFATSITEALDSTRSVARVEGIDDGGVLGRMRKGTKQMRVRGLLMGRGRRGVEYGQAWLSSAVDPGACGQHGSRCGLTDLEWFADCPPARGVVREEDYDRPQTDDEYRATVDGYRRYLHDVAAISGPIITNTLNAGDFWAYEVELIFAAERPWVYGKPRPVEIPPTPPVAIQDIPYNLVPYPSAELDSGVLVTIATNYSLNPSVEVNANGWSVGGGTNIPAAQVSGGRSTELAAVGSASYRALFVAGSANDDGRFFLQQIVDLPEVRPYSISVWAAANVQSGAAVIGGIRVFALWQDNSTTLRTDTLGDLPASGGAISVPGITPPAGTVKVVVRVEAMMTTWSSGAAVRLYGDALAVTFP